MSQIEALVYVCTTSLAELQAGLANLEDADSRTIDARLRTVEGLCTTLSGGLDKLSKFMDDLPADDPNAAQKGPQKPVDDGGVLLKAALRIGEILESAQGSFGDHEGFDAQ